LTQHVKRGNITNIIVVDGNSTDDTLKIAKRYETKLLFDGGRGFFGAYDVGWRETTDDLVMFVDSDAYLGPNFFPDAFTFFEEERTGAIVATAHAVTDNRIGRMVGEWWRYRAESMAISITHSQVSMAERIYQKLASLSEAQNALTGPCYVIRRSCLESIRGVPEDGDDFILGRKIIQRGWNLKWWSDAEVYHYTKTNLEDLLRQYFRFGYRGSLIYKRYYKFSARLIRITSYLGAPIMGLAVAKRSKDPLHALLIPLTRYVEGIGFFMGILSHEEPHKERMLSKAFR
jgi:cellulose synthase/poly-beta-1,6-N-acetylglucosamine synthase-like glycosyltransferase